MAGLRKYDLIIVGAGASGLVAAGRAAELGARVLIIEKNDRAGKKLLITGKGRCNITNSSDINEHIKHIHPNGRIMKNAYHRFFYQDIIDILQQYGVKTVLERGNRVFPESNKSIDVLNALLRWNQKNQVEIKYQHKAVKLIKEESAISGVEVLYNNEHKNFLCNKLIVCTGGLSYPATGSTGDGYKFAEQLGHTITPLFPSLVPLETNLADIKQLQGLSLKNSRATLRINNKKAKEEFGELMFTHFGLSGPIILTLSRIAVDALMKKEKVEISLDLKPALDEAKLDARLIRDLNEMGKKRFENILKTWVPALMVDYLLKNSGIEADKEGHQVSGKERKRILFLLKNIIVPITGFRPFKEAIITAGGICTKEISFKTMESAFCQNLYFAGEILDLDADTGGYNLQIAFSTAWIAAEACSPDDPLE
jgi:predicted Rossmann fold flavoprotein